MNKNENYEHVIFQKVKKNPKYRKIIIFGTCQEQKK